LTIEENLEIYKRAFLAGAVVLQIGYHCVAQAGLNLKIFLPQHHNPQVLDYRYVPPCVAYKRL
jgi:hypothetical protein